MARSKPSPSVSASRKTCTGARGWGAGTACSPASVDEPLQQGAEVGPCVVDAKGGNAIEQGFPGLVGCELVGGKVSRTRPARQLQQPSRLLGPVGVGPAAGVKPGLLCPLLQSAQRRKREWFACCLEAVKKRRKIQRGTKHRSEPLSSPAGKLLGGRPMLKKWRDQQLLDSFQGQRLDESIGAGPAPC